MKTRDSYTFSVEPRSEMFADLLICGLSYCSAGLLVVRPSLGLSDKAQAFLKDLAPFITGVDEASSWPGTDLLHGNATIYRFSFVERVHDLIRSVSEGLYDWRQPLLPEDLCLLRADGEPWLISISHEGDAAVLITGDERTEIEQSFPDLAQRLLLDPEGQA
jgi:hypothetical protein